jgi:hypothetical protein
MAPGWLATTEAALNAVLGDYLERRENGLAIEMGFYHDGAPLSLSPEALCAAHPRIGSRIVVLVHGMAMTEACWSFPGESERSYGTMLQRELGLVPFYVRYNSGRRVSHNGRDLAVLLERLVESAPVPIEDITLIGHSMGGLLIRSACHYAERLGLSWIHETRRAFYLGSPHLGAPLEKAGHFVSLALGAIDHPVVRLTHTLANLRSAGVKDMRHGSLLDEDWPSEGLGPRRGPPLPLRAGMDHHLIAGTLTRDESHFVAQLFGDALVRVASAIAPGRREGLPTDHVTVLPGIHHMELAHSDSVYARIRDALGAAVADPSLDIEPPSPPVPAVAGDDLARADAYRALLEDAVEHGSTAIQEVQMEMTARPYDLLERIPPLEVPAKLVRAAHFAGIRFAYGATRSVNRLVGALVHEGIEWAKKWP